MQGIIVKQISNDYTIHLDNDEYVVCKARGKFRNMHITPLVGDYVTIDYENKYILEIHPRKNELIRPTIANVDQAVIITSVYIPNFSSNLLDKLLVIIEYNNIKPIICFTKLDLIDDEYRKEIDNYIKYYRKIGYDVYLNTDEEIKDIFKDKVTVFAGQSGAGKSTLLNHLDKSLTPGFSSLDFIGMTNSDIRDCFTEFNKYRDKCQYQDCMHKNESDCEVKRQVQLGNIMASRYDNYLKFIDRKENVDY